MSKEERLDPFLRRMGRHENAVDLVKWISNPDELEKYTEDEIKDLMEKAGYESEDGCAVTIGWAKTSPTTSVFMEKGTNRMLEIGVGGHGSYTLSEMFRDVKNITRVDYKLLMKYREDMRKGVNYSFGKDARKILEEAEEPEVDMIEESEKVVPRTEKVKPKREKTRGLLRRLLFG